MDDMSPAPREADAPLASPGASSIASPSTPPADAPMTPLRKVVLLLVVAISIWHVGAIVIWMMPSSYTRDRILAITRRYTLLTKSDQFWSMFAPDPLSLNRQLVVRATLDSGEEREVNLTAPANAAIRSWSFVRVGRTLKAHDRILGGDENKYLHGFALHTCRELSQEWGQHVKTLAIFRDYYLVSVDPATFKSTKSKTERASLGAHACSD